MQDNGGTNNMANLQRSITHSIKFLQDMKINSIAITDIITTYADLIDSYDKDMESYGGNVRYQTSKFRKDYKECLDTFDTDYNLFKESMTEIIQYKNDPDVIYYTQQFKNFGNYYKDYKEKILDKKIEKIESTKETYMRQEDYVRAIAYNAILTKAKEVQSMIETIIKKMDTLFGKKRR